MNVFDFIQNQGRTTVPNPKYNKKTKQGRRQPQFIEVPDTQPDNDSGVNVGQQDLLNGWSVDKKTSDKYAKYGINYNPREAATSDARFNLDNQLADAQSLGDKVWNAATQSLYSQLILGTIKGFGDIVGGLASIPEIWSEGTDDNDYTNRFSEYFEQKQQEFEENNPIYVRSDASPFSPSSIVSHIPTIAGIASMALTTKGALGVVGAAAKGTKLTKIPTLFRQSKIIGAVDKEAGTLKDLNDMNRAAAILNNPTNVARANAFVGNSLSGIVNTAMWNYSSAHGVYNQVYNELSDSFRNLNDDDYNRIVSNAHEVLGDDFDTSDRDAVAKRIASASANRAYSFDWLNTAFMIPQYYALRNVGRNLKNQESNFFIRKAQQNRIKQTEQLFMSDAEKKAADAALTRWDKLTPQVTNFLKSSGKMAGSQLLGALQMGVVNIGSQEGVSYGKALVDGGNTDALRNLDTYLSSPELWEEMAWGAVAGSAFHLIGNGLKTAVKVHEGKKIGEKEAAKQSTEDGKKAVKEFYATGNIANATRKIAMDATVNDFETYVKNAKLINDGFNPYDAQNESYKENGEDKQHVVYSKLPEDSELVDEIKDMNETDFITKSALRAARNGNLKLEKEYIKSDAVKKVMLQQGVVKDEAEATELQSKILDTMDEVDKEYDRQLFNVTTQINAINHDNQERRNSKKKPTFDGDIPLQYAAEIANENTAIEMNNRAADKAITRLSESTNARIQDWVKKGKLTQGYDYASYYNDQVISTRLGQLYAQKDKLLKENGKDAISQFKLGRIQKDIDSIHEQLDINNENPTANGLARQLFIIGNAKGFTAKEETPGSITYDYDSKGTSERLSGLFKKVDDKLVGDIKGIGDIIGRTDLEGKVDPTDLYESWTKLIDVKDQQTPKGGQNDSVRTGQKDISQLDPKLDEDLLELSKLKINRALATNNLRNTRDEIGIRSAEIDNDLNQAKKKMLDQAVGIIMGINEAHNKDGKNPIDMANYIHRFNEGESVDSFEKLDDKEKANLKSALTTLDLTNVNNNVIEAGLKSRLATVNKLYEAIRSQKEKDNKDMAEREEKSTTNQNLSESTDESSSNSNSANANESNSEQGTQPTEQQQTQQGQPQTNIGENQNTESPAESPAGTPAVSSKDTRTRQLTDISSVTYSKKGTTEYYADENEDGEARINTAVLRSTDTPNVFELVGAKNKPLSNETISNEDFYEIDTLPKDGGVPVQNPLVKVDDNGKIIILQRGKVDDINKYQDVEQRSDVDNVQESRPIESTSEGEAESQQFSSTGGQDTTPESIDNSYADDDHMSARDRAGKDLTAFDFGKTEHTHEKPTSAKDYQFDKEEGVNDTGYGRKLFMRNTFRQIVDTFKKNTPGRLTDESYEILSKLLENQFSEPSDKPEIDKIIQNYRIRQERKADSVKDKRRELADAVVDATFTAEPKGRKSTTTEGNILNKDGYTNIFRDAADKLLDYFVKSNKLEVKNGKPIINPENIYRNSNKLSDNPLEARMMSDMMANYLKSEEGRNKYIINSEESFDKALIHAEMTEAQRMKVLTKVDNNFRINLNDVLDHYETLADKTMSEKAVKEVQKLNVGDGLEINVTHDGRIQLSSNGIVLGDMPIPNVDKAHGYYYMENRGVKTDVKIDSHGNVSSRLYSWLRDVINDNTAAGESMRRILQTYQFGNKDEKKALWEEFNNNPFVTSQIDNAKRKKYTVFNVTEHKGVYGLQGQQVLDHLSKIYTYKRVDVGASPDEIRANRLAIVDSWFKKLYKDYTIADQIAKHPDRFRSNVSHITDGEIIRADEKVDANGNVTNDSKAKMTLSSKALGVLLQGKGKIGVMGHTYMDTGMMHIAGDTDKMIPNFGAGNTFMVLPNRSGEPEYVQAYPIRATDTEALKGTKAGEIMNAVYNEVKNAIEDATKLRGKTEKQAVNDLYDILYNLYGPGKSRIASENNVNNLLRGVIIRTSEHGFQIKDRYSDRSWNINFEDNYGNPALIIIEQLTRKTGTVPAKYGKEYAFNRDIKGYSQDKQEAIKEIIDFIKNRTAFTINDAHVMSDNDTHENLVGAATRDNGDFVVKIGKKEWRFKDYNDYIINNNIVRVNTKSYDGITNFRRIGARNVRGNQNLEVNIREKRPNKKDLVVKPYDPTEERIRIEKEESETRDKVMEVLAGNRSSDDYNTGRKLANILLGSKLTDKYSKKMPKGFALFPKDIIFDEDFNNIKLHDKDGNIVDDYTNVNAETNTNDVPIKIGERVVLPNQTVFGTKLMSMFVSQETRPEAVRKLIHERLHQIIHYTDEDGQHPNTKYVKQVKDAFDLFVNANKKEGIKDDGILQYEYNNSDYRDANGNITIDGLEEFLVDAITSKQLAKRLDEIEVKGAKAEKPKSLLQKIMDVVYQLLGIDDFKDGTLRTKLFNDLRDVTEKAEVKAEKADKAKRLLNKNKKKGTIEEGNLFTDADFDTEDKNLDPSRPVEESNADKPDTTSDNTDSNQNPTPADSNTEPANNNNGKDTGEPKDDFGGFGSLGDADWASLDSTTDEFSGLKRSTTTETDLSDSDNNSSSADSQQDRLPFNERAKFNDMVERGEISIIC